MFAVTITPDRTPVRRHSYLRGREGLFWQRTTRKDVRQILLACAERDWGTDPYTAHQVLRIAIDRTNHLDLYLRGPRRSAVPHARWLLAGLLRIFGERERPQLNL